MLNASVYVLQPGHSVPASPSFFHGPQEQLQAPHTDLPVYNNLISVIATGKSKYSGARVFENSCWSSLEMLLIGIDAFQPSQSKNHKFKSWGKGGETRAVFGCSHPAEQGFTAAPGHALLYHS